MAYRLTKADREKLGMRFAETLLCRSSARPDELPELLARKDWKEAAPHDRTRACSEIAQEARGILLKSGYPKEQVEKATRNFIRY